MEIEKAGKVDDNTRLVPDDAAADVILALNAELGVRTDEEQAERLMRALLAGYPDLRPHDAKGYMTKITRAFMAYPLGVSMTVATDMPKKHNFHPREADLAAALKEEKDRVLVLIGNAMAQRQERRRRAEARAEEAKYAAAHTPEAKARVKAIYEKTRAALKSMEEPNAR